MNKKTLESLVKAGALDRFGNRASLLIAIPEAASKANQMKKQALEGQASLFGDTNPVEEHKEASQSDIDDFTKEEKLNFEKELLGFYLTSHPYSDILQYLKKLISHEIEFLEGEKEGTMVKIGGIIETTKKIFTKKSNAEMAFIQISDEKGISIECVIFPRIFEEYKSLLIQDTVIVIEGKLNMKEDRPIIIAEKITSAKNLQA